MGYFFLVVKIPDENWRWSDLTRMGLFKPVGETTVTSPRLLRCPPKLWNAAPSFRAHVASSVGTAQAGGSRFAGPCRASVRAPGNSGRCHLHCLQLQKVQTQHWRSWNEDVKLFPRILSYKKKLNANTYIVMLLGWHSESVSLTGHRFCCDLYCLQIPFWLK